MGQYYYTVNLDKGEYLHPHRFGQGLKLLEFGCDSGGVGLALTVLASNGNGRGGGDFHLDDVDQDKLPILPGHWAGDRILVAGDYGDEGEFLTDEQIQEWRETFSEEEWAERKRYGGEDPLPNVFDYAERCMKNISSDVQILLAADEWVRKDILRSLLDGFAKDSEENVSTVKAIVDLYGCQGHVDEVKAEIKAHWDKIREKNAKYGS